MNRDEIVAFAGASISNIFGMTHEPSASDIELFTRWLDVYGFPSDLVELAMSITAQATEYNRMMYADRVMLDFHKRGIRTVDEAEEMLRNQHSNQNKQRTVKSAYVNGGQRTVQVPVREDKKIQTPSAKMRPCPFCGYEVIYLVIQNSTKFGTKFVSAECGQCQARSKNIGIHYDASDDVVAETLPEGQQAIDLWNTRVRGCI